MKASLFAQMGYAERHQFPATWPVPPSYHDPAVTMQSYEDGLEECELAEEMGFDWISCSEHHYSGNRLTPNPAVMAAAAIAGGSILWWLGKTFHRGRRVEWGPAFREPRHVGDSTGAATVYRADALDATHSPVFAQVGLLKRVTGLLYFPITPTFPHFGFLGMLGYLPAKFKLRFLEPIEFGPGDSHEDKALVQTIAHEVRARIQENLWDMLAKRKSVWFG